MGKGPGLIYKAGVAQAIKAYKSKTQPPALKDIAKQYEFAVLPKLELLQMFALEDYPKKKAESYIQEWKELQMLLSINKGGYDLVVFLHPKAVIY